jgi:hypothetical protein
VRYCLVSVLAVAVCATLAGARSYTAIAEWACDAPQGLRAGLGLPGGVPDLVTIWRVLTAVDPLAFDRVIGSRVSAHLAQSRPHPVRAVLAVDGKTVRGARTGDGRAPHLMACLDHDSGVVRAQVAVDGKTNEIPMFAVVLDQIADLAGAVVTADAMHAQREHAAYLHGRGAHYLLTVKGNQPGLRGQLRALPWKDVPAGHTQAGRAHGRTEKRVLKAATVTAGLAFLHAERPSRSPARPASTNGAPRPPTRSAPCPPHRPSRPSSPPGSAGTGRSRTSCTGSVLCNGLDHPVAKNTLDQRRCLLGENCSRTVRRLGATELIGATPSRPRPCLPQPCRPPVHPGEPPAQDAGKTHGHAAGYGCRDLAERERRVTRGPVRGRPGVIRRAAAEVAAEVISRTVRQFGIGACGSRPAQDLASRSTSVYHPLRW